MTTLSIEAANAVEGYQDQTPLEFTVSLSESSIDAVTVEYRTLLAGTALDRDLSRGSATTYNNGTLTFAPGETTQTITIWPRSDELDERDEHIVVQLFNPDGAVFASDAPVAQATGVILDDDGEDSNLALFTSDPILVEGDSGARTTVFEIRLSRPAPEGFTARYTTADATARAGEDYTAVSGTIAFSAGQSVATVEVPVLGDTISERLEQFSLIVAPLDGPSMDTKGAVGEATILDDDAAIVPTISIAPAEAVEEGNTLRFVVTLSEASFDAVSVNYRTRLTGTALDTDLNHSATSSNNNGTLTFAPGETSKSLFIDVNGAFDELDERDEDIALELYAPEGASLAGDGSILRATGVILDDDGYGSNLALLTSDPVLIEGDSGDRLAVFEVRLSRPAPTEIAVGYQTIDGTATSGSDYTATSGTLSFALGQEIAAIAVPVIGDTVSELPERFSLALSPQGTLTGEAAGLQNTVGEATILDDDAASGPTLSVEPADSVGEGYNFLRFVVTLSEASLETVSVNYRTRLAGTAQREDLYSPATASENNGTLTFAPGETTKSLFIRSGPDDLDERDEHITLELFDPDGASLAGEGPVLQSTGVILDDDGVGPNLSLLTSDPILVEGDSGQKLAVFEVRLSQPAPTDLTLSYQTRDVTATAGTDYVEASGTLAFVQGQQMASVAVPVLGDTDSEPSELFSLIVVPPNDISIGTDGAVGDATILDDDSDGDPTISLATADPASETLYDGYIRFVVTLSEPSTEAITVEHRTLLGTADETDLGYDWDQTGTLTFEPGETTKSIFVSKARDFDDERDETVFLELSNSSGARLAGELPYLRATGVVLDNDGVGLNQILAFSDELIREPDETSILYVPVMLTRPATEEIVYAVNATEQTAELGSDFELIETKVTFSPGQTFAGIPVRVFADGASNESIETFTLEYSPVEGAAALDTDEVQTVTIIDTQNPIAEDDFARTAASSAIVIDVLANDSDPDGDTLNVSTLSAPSNGTVILNDDNSILYTPNYRFTGTDQFRYTVSDGNGGTDTATVTVGVGVIGPICDVLTAASDGDPHLRTFDGVGYSFQAVGEFILFRTEDGRSTFQVRQEPWGNSDSVSVNTALSTRLGEDIVGLYVGQDNPLIVNGVPATLAAGQSLSIGTGMVSRDGSAYIITDDQGNGVWARPSTTQNFMNLRPFVCNDQAGDIEGLLGNADGERANDFTLRDGRVLAQPLAQTQLYGEFADSWRISQDESLFVYAEDESTETFTDRRFPANAITLADLDPQARTAAEALAEAAGLEPGSFTFETTVIDIALTDVGEFANAAAETPDFVPDDVEIVPVEFQPLPGAYYTLTDATPAEFFLATGLDAQLLGDTAGKTINLPTGAIGRRLDPNTFVNLEDASTDYVLQRNGAILELFDSTGDLVSSLRASSTETSSLRFSDGAADLAFKDGNIVIGGAVLNEDEPLAGSALTVDGTLTSSGVFTAANALSGSVAATAFLALTNASPETFTLGTGLVVELLGNSAGKAINIPQGAGAEGVDPNTTLYIEGASSAFTFSRNGTTLEVRDDAGHLTASLKGSSTETSTLVFADGFLELAVADSQLTLGGITFTDGLSVPGADLTVDPSETSEARFGIDLDALGGTAQNPASVDAGDGALTFYDDVAVASNTQVSDFGTDDTLVLQGVSAADIDLSVSDGNTRFEFNDGAGTVSQITLIGVSGDHTTVAEFNDNANLGDVIVA